MFVYAIKYNCWLYFIFCISPYISTMYEVIIPLYCCYIHYCFNMLVNVIKYLLQYVYVVHTI